MEKTPATKHLKSPFYRFAKVSESSANFYEKNKPDTGISISLVSKSGSVRYPGLYNLKTVGVWKYAKCWYCECGSGKFKMVEIREAQLSGRRNEYKNIFYTQQYVLIHSCKCMYFRLLNFGQCLFSGREGGYIELDETSI